MGFTHHKPALLARATARLLVAVGLLAALLAPAAVANAQVEQLAGWQFQLMSCNGAFGFGTGNFVSGPGVPPLGSGSFEYTVAGDGLALVDLRQNGYNEVRLDSLTELAYDTYVSLPGTRPVAAFMMLDVDVNGDGTVEDQLVFQPALQGTVTGYTWQHWDALNGTWWSRSGLAGMGQSSGGGTLEDYLAVYPNARIVNSGAAGGLHVSAGCLGSEWGGFAGAADAVVVGVEGVSVTYDFEEDGVHTSRPPLPGEEVPGVPVFEELFPNPFTTSEPGGVIVGARIHSDSAIEDVTLLLDGEELDPEIAGPNASNVTAFTEQDLDPGVYTATVTATDADGDTFQAQWDFIVADNAAEGEWFDADGNPKADEINATMRSLVEAFRWHLFGQSWDGHAHPEMPTHVDEVTQAAPLETWVTGDEFDQEATEATLRSLVEAFRWHFWGESWDGKDHEDVPTHAEEVLPPGDIDPWFDNNGDPIPENIDATLRSLVEAFRWHFWGYSWDGGHHFTDMPTHAE